MVGTIFFSGLLLYGFIDGQADFSVIVAYGILIAFSGICTLHLFLWRVKINHDVIEYRSFFGKNQKKIAKISARNRNVDWLQVKIAEIKKDKKKLERKK